MVRFTVIIPDSVAEWVKKSCKEEGVSQSAFVSNMLSYAMAGISRDIRIMDLEDKTYKTYLPDHTPPPDVREIKFETRDAAEVVVAATSQLFNTRPFFTIEELYMLSGISDANYKDAQYGWKRGILIEIEEQDGLFRLVLPTPQRL